ncbi:MAG: FAD-dependent oxidoreductase [Ardenticatenia bacterium]|nr:FAD-dependent oxidoreductase [Ardenticatenia bacterium]
MRTPEEFARHDIRVFVHHEVLAVDPDAQTVRVRDTRSGRTFTQPWGALVLTTGGQPSRPPIPGLNLAGIFTLRVPEDALAIKRWLVEQRPRHGVIVGGGYIGVEMAEALVARGVHTTVVEMLPQLLPTFDADMAAHVEKTLANHGVEVRLEHRVEGFEGDNRVRAVVAAGRTFPADMVIFSVGVRPAVTLARQAGLTLGPTGAVAVDERQRTSHPAIWAAGDVTEVHHLVTGQPAYIPLGTTANKQGRVAGTNAAGGEATFRGVVGTAAVQVFDVEVARTGLSEREAHAHGLQAASVTITASANAHYMPEHAPLHIKLVFERGSRRLLGAQIVGRTGAAKRVDIVAAALHAGWTTAELAALDLSYHPAVAPVWDPVLVAANVANR